MLSKAIDGQGKWITSGRFTQPAYQMGFRSLKTCEQILEVEYLKGVAGIDDNPVWLEVEADSLFIKNY